MFFVLVQRGHSPGEMSRNGGLRPDRTQTHVPGGVGERPAGRDKRGTGRARASRSRPLVGGAASAERLGRGQGRRPRERARGGPGLFPRSGRAPPGVVLLPGRFRRKAREQGKREGTKKQGT